MHCIFYLVPPFQIVLTDPTQRVYFDFAFASALQHISLTNCWTIISLYHYPTVSTHDWPIDECPSPPGNVSLGSAREKGRPQTGMSLSRHLPLWLSYFFRTCTSSSSSTLPFPVLPASFTSTSTRTHSYLRTKDLPSLQTKTLNLR